MDTIVMMAAHAALMDALPRYTIQYLLWVWVGVYVSVHANLYNSVQISVCLASPCLLHVWHFPPHTNTPYIPQIEPASIGIQAKGRKPEKQECTTPKPKACPIRGQCVVLNGEDPADFAQPAHDPPVVDGMQHLALFLVVHMAK